MMILLKRRRTLLNIVASNGVVAAVAEAVGCGEPDHPNIHRIEVREISNRPGL
jgi:hypothetical protein